VSADNRGCPGVRGKEIGAVFGRAVIMGSAYPWADHSERGRNLGDRTLNPISNVGIDANGLPVYPQVNPLMACVRAPAWDAADFFTASWGTTRLEKWSTTRMLDTCDALRAAFPPSTFANWQPMNIGSDWHSITWGKDGPTPLSTSWIFPTADINAIALARNAVVVTQAKNTAAPQSNWTWWLSILSRSTATVVWETQLPGIPLQEGLAIARDGTILVAFKNGDVYGYGSGDPVRVASREVSMTQPISGSRTSADGWAILPAPGAGNGGVRAGEALPRVSNGLGVWQSQSAANASVVLLDGPVPLSVPLATNTAILPDGSRAPMHLVTPGDPAGIAFHPADMSWQPERECLPVVSVAAKSSARGTYAAHATDRDLRTRWTPAAGGAQSLEFDLGASRNVAAISMVWYSPRAARVPYALEVSQDGKRFERVDEGVLSGRGTKAVLRTFLPVSARFARLVTESSTGGALSVYEVGLHGESAEVAAR
jgi:hypothetical protein